MPRQTRKYQTAYQKALSEGIRTGTDQEKLYTRLNEAGWWWDSASGEWVKGTPLPADGQPRRGRKPVDMGDIGLQPTRTLRIRIEGREDIAADMARAQAQLLQLIGCEVEISPMYQDRPPRDWAWRIFLTVTPPPGFTYDAEFVDSAAKYAERKPLIALPKRREDA